MRPVSHRRCRGRPGQASVTRPTLSRSPNAKPIERPCRVTLDEAALIGADIRQLVGREPAQFSELAGEALRPTRDAVRVDELYPRPAVAGGRFEQGPDLHDKAGLLLYLPPQCVLEPLGA